MTEYKCRRYAVTFENDGCVRIQSFEDIPNFEKNLLCVKPLRAILGKSEFCRMTEVSGAFDKTKNVGNINLPNISEGNDRQRWVYIGGDKVCSFLTDDDIYKKISNMGNNLIPYSIAKGEENF